MRAPNRVEEKLSTPEYGTAYGFKENFYNASGVLDDIALYHSREATFQKTTFKHYRYNGSILLLGYFDGEITCIVKEYCGCRFILEVKEKDTVIRKYPFDANDEYMRCLKELYELREIYPKTWLYKLDRIYRTYGSKIVNTVRYYGKFLQLIP